MMHFSLEFEPRLTDFFRLASDRRSRCSLIARRTIVACVLLFGLYDFYTNGLDWEIGIIVVVVIMFGVPFYFTYIFLWLFFALWRPVIQVSIDDDSIYVGSKKHQQNLPWSSFANSGSATEFKSHFWFTCGRGTLWVPKLAIKTVAELAAFRQFVIDKIGDRCKFDDGQDC